MDITLKKFNAHNKYYMKIRGITMEELTKQQNRIVGLLAEGYNNYEIADELNIAYRTVKQHISMIIKKLEVRNRMEIVVLYYKGKIEELEEKLGKEKEESR